MACAIVLFLAIIIGFVKLILACTCTSCWACAIALFIFFWQSLLMFILCRQITHRLDACSVTWFKLLALQAFGCKYEWLYHIQYFFIDCIYLIFGISYCCGFGNYYLFCEIDDCMYLIFGMCYCFIYIFFFWQSLLMFILFGYLVQTTCSTGFWL